MHGRFYDDFERNGELYTNMSYVTIKNLSFAYPDEAEKLIQSGQDEYIHAKDHLDSTWDNMIEESRILAQKRATVYQLIENP